MTKKWLVRFGWMAAGVVALYGLSALAGSALGGPLDPPGAPAPSMKTLDEIPSTWSRLLGAGGADPCNTQRFTCVLGAQAVRDNETGLVWERTPSTMAATWSASRVACGDSTVGGRQGWRLPTDAEVRSLLDPSSSLQPILPEGHPFGFSAGPFGTVWTVSPVPDESDDAYSVDVDTLDRNPAPKTTPMRRWCVRGAQADAPEESALAEQPPSWYRTLDATGGCFSERFRCVMGNEAVLDRETGLVWERTLDDLYEQWAGARFRCFNKQLGGRYGFRLATLEEMKTLFGESTPDRLPTGHPFLGVPSGVTTTFWTATTWPDDATYAYVFETNTPGGGLGHVTKTLGTYQYWCVRGGSGYDGM